MFNMEKIKDVVLLTIAIFSIIAHLSQFSGLPESVRESIKQLKNLEDKSGSQELRIQALELNLGNLVKGIDEIKNILQSRRK